MKLQKRYDHWWLWISCVLIVLPMLVACSGTSQQSNQTTSFSTFDASAPKSTINADDSVQMTLDQCTDVAPSYWNTQNHIMTVPVPILFNDNRIPTLKIEKILIPLAKHY